MKRYLLQAVFWVNFGYAVLTLEIEKHSLFAALQV